MPNNTWSEKGEVHSVMSQCFGGSLWRGRSLRAACVGGSDVTGVWWLSLARRKFTGRACWWKWCHSVLVARFGEEAVLRAVCVGGSEVTGVWWLSSATRKFTGRACWWKWCHSVLVARFGEGAVYGPCMLVGVMSQCFGGSLCRESSLRPHVLVEA